MYYGNEAPTESNTGYPYGVNNHNQQNRNNPQGNQYIQVPQFNNPDNNYNSTGQCAYPQTGLTAADAEVSDTRTEFILPENVKVGLIMLSICCLTCFFVLLLVK